MHWARLEASALGSLIAACPAWKRRERERSSAVSLIQYHYKMIEQTITCARHKCMYNMIMKIIQYRDISILQNSIWPPSTTSYLSGEVVRPPTKSPVKKFCHDWLSSVQVKTIGIFFHSLLKVLYTGP